MANDLTRYETARKALAECLSVDEVKDIKDKADAMRHYAKRAKNRELLIHAVEISARSERRLGEMLIEENESGRIDRGGRPHKKTSAKKSGVKKLEDLGVTSEFSSRAQRLAKLPEAKFEEVIALWREESANDTRITINMLAFAYKHFPPPPPKPKPKPKANRKPKPDKKPKPGEDEQPGDDKIPDDLKPTPQEYHDGFMVRASEAYQFAYYSKEGLLDQRIVDAAYVTASAWTKLAQRLEKELHKVGREDIDA